MNTDRSSRSSFSASLLVASLALLLLPVPGWGQTGRVDGRVVATSGQPVPGATVTVAGVSERATTGPDGTFSISGVDSGTRRLEVRAAGYRTGSRRVTVGTGADDVTIRLTPDPDALTYRLDPLTVTASRTRRRLSQVPASVSVLQGERLDRLMAESPDDVLRSLPNVTSVGGPRGVAELPQIRGFGSERIVLRVDGARQSFGSGHKGRLFLDPALLQRVEVVRGPTSALYGSGGIGGVVGFETVDARDLLRSGSQLGYSLTPRFLSGSEELGGRGLVAGQTGQLDFLASASVRSSDDVSLSTGNELPFSAGDSWSGLATIGWEPGPFQRVEASWNRYSRASTTPINANQPDTLQSKVADRSSLRSTATVNYRLSDPETPGLDLDVTAYRNASEVEERRLSDGRLEVRNVVTWGLDASNTSRLEISEDVRTDVTLGTELYRDEAEGRQNGESLGTFPGGTADFVGLYAQNRWTFADRVHLIPGVRWDHIHQANASEDVEDSDEAQVSLKAAAEVEATEFLDVFGSWGEGFNAPRLLDLYISGLHFPSPPRARFPDNFFVSNPSLEPEKAESWETGARLTFEDVITDGDGLRGGVTYFHTDAEDFIAREVNIREGTTTFRNLDRVEAEGVEARFRYEAGPVFGRASYGQVRMRNLTEEAPVNDAPADTWGLDLGARLANRALTLGYSGTLAEDQRRVTDEEFETSGYVVSDLFAGWAADEGPLSGVAVQMRLENVFDATYTRHGSFIPAPGRSLRLEITYRSGLQTP